MKQTVYTFLLTVYFPNGFSEFLTGVLNSFDACSANRSIFDLFFTFLSVGFLFPVSVQRLKPYICKCDPPHACAQLPFLLVPL